MLLSLLRRPSPPTASSRLPPRAVRGFCTSVEKRRTLQFLWIEAGSSLFLLDNKMRGLFSSDSFDRNKAEVMEIEPEKQKFSLAEQDGR